MSATKDPAHSPPLAEDLRAHAAWLRRLAIRLAGHGADGDDAVGDTLTAAVARPPARREALRPWLATVLRNFLRLQARSRRNRSQREEAVAALAAPSLPSPEELLVRHEALSLLADEVRRLEEPYRSTLLLCYAEDLAPAEIARLQGVPAGTVRWRLKRGLDEIRLRLQSRDEGRAWVVTVGLGALPAPSTTIDVGTGLKGALLMKAGTQGTLMVIGILLALGAAVSWWLLRPGPPPGTTASPADHERRRSPPRRFGEQPPAEDAPAAVIEGTVRDGAGRAIAGANVTIAPAAWAGPDDAAGKAAPALVGLAVTGGDGRFQLASSPGVFRITASAPGFLPGQRDHVAVRAGQTVSGVDLRLAAGGHPLSGRVLDTGSGPIAGARLRVWIDGGWVASPAHPMVVAQAGGDGAYRISLPAGTHAFVVEADGYAAQRASVTVAGAQIRDFRLHPAAVIAGRVLRRGTGAPVPGARVRAESRGYFAEADADAAGAFAITNLEPGDYALHAVAAPLAGTSVLPVIVGLAARVDGVVIEVEAGRTISGRVRRPGGAPVPGARILLRESLPFQGQAAGLRGEGRTADDGSYRIEAVLPGAYLVAADGRASRRVTMADGDATGIDLELVDTATVRGRVTDLGNHPVADALVRAHVDEADRGPAGIFGPAQTDAEGRFLIEKVEPGPLTVIARHAEKGTAFTEAGMLRSSEVREVVVRLGKPGARIRGRALWEDGSPAAGLVVQSLVMGGSGSSSAATGPDGRYSIGPFEAGWLVMVSVEQASAWRREDVQTEVNRPVRIRSVEDVEDVDFKLPRADARLAGVVVGPDDRPLAGTVVSTRPQRAGALVVTGDDGRFSFEGLLRGKYLVHAAHPGLPPVEATGVAAGTEDLRIRIEAGGVLAGRVARADGGRLGAFTIWAQPAQPRDRAPALDERPAPVTHEWVQAGDGAFELGGLAPGVYDLAVATLDGDSGGLAGVALGAGQARRDLAVEVTTGITLVGRVVDIDSRAPLEGVLARAGSEGRKREARTDATGTFRLEGLMRGVPSHLTLEMVGFLPYSREWIAPVDRSVRDLGTLPLLADRYGEKPSGPVGRIGMTFSRDDEGRMLVRNAAPASPAGKAGLKPGDVISSVDRRDVRNADLGNFVLLVAGKPGAPVVFEVRTGDTAPRRVTVVRM
jgi:RNA polymerase sigma-70 factor (ECF subfamily)